MKTLTVALLCLSATARATTSSCIEQPDGTPCETECTVDGACKSQRCIGGTPIADGTLCATGNDCTVDDVCQAGLCTPGPERQCPAVPCYTGSCVPHAGCVYLKFCQPGDTSSGQPLAHDGDGGVVIVAPDDGGSPSQLVARADGGGSDGEVVRSDGNDGDATNDPTIPHVHGSGCAIGHRATPSPFWLTTLFFVLGLALRRKFAE